MDNHLFILIPFIFPTMVNPTLAWGGRSIVGIINLTIVGVQIENIYSEHTPSLTHPDALQKSQSSAFILLLGEMTRTVSPHLHQHSCVFDYSKVY